MKAESRQILQKLATRLKFAYCRIRRIKHWILKTLSDII